VSDVPPGVPSSDVTPEPSTEAAPETLEAASRAEEATKEQLEDSGRTVDQDIETAPEE
jgi:hypothetical protein